jgi:HemK-related putative methylase
MPPTPRARATSSRPVYPPREDSRLLLPFAAQKPRTSNEWTAEVGSGRGLVALAAARAGARVVATDLNPSALTGLRSRALAEGLRVETVRTDLVRGLRPVARIFANPPYLPTRARDRDPDPWENLALDGGPDGWAVAGRLLRSLPRQLAAGGQAYLLVSSRQSARRGRALLRDWRRASGRTRAVASARMPDGERLTVWRLWRVRDSRVPAPAPRDGERETKTPRRGERRSVEGSAGPKSRRREKGARIARRRR